MIKYLTNKLRTQSINEENSNNEKVSYRKRPQRESDGFYFQGKTGENRFPRHGKFFPTARHYCDIFPHLHVFVRRSEKFFSCEVWRRENKSSDRDGELRCVSERAIK
jgi:hypothetical protein